MAIANTTIQVRKSGTTGAKPTSLANGELAINYADDKLYYVNKLGNISYFYGANNGPSFSTANANNTLLIASTPNDTLSISGSDGVSVTACTTTKTVTIGYQGTIGPQGYQGVQGSQGNQGVQGSQGNQGFQGVQGDVGAQGSQGNQGVQGAVGAQGSQGYQGVQGVQGSQGNQGVQGAVGAQGFTGAQGNQGVQGAQGSQGNQGVQGAAAGVNPSNYITQGKLGTNQTIPSGIDTNIAFDTADFDPQGWLNVSNYQITPNIAGYYEVTTSVVMPAMAATGQTNLQLRKNGNSFTITQQPSANNAAPVTLQATRTIYLNGSTDYITASVWQGTGGNITLTTGNSVWITVSLISYGINGAVGAQGVQGATGPQGNQGVQGSQGNQGFQGAQGAQGYQGVQGSQGIQGATGPQGLTGAQGSQGVQGAQGSQGYQGVQGEVGAQGSQGYQGVQGAQGATGPQGSQGYQGTQGPTPESTTYTANSIALTGGSYVSGNLYSVQHFNDGDYYILTDGSGVTPAWYVDIGFTNVTAFNVVDLNLSYTVNSGHIIYVQLYNYTTSTWDNIGQYSGLSGFTQFQLGVISSNPYISSNTANVRLYHSNAGNVSHTTQIDYVALVDSISGGQGPKGPQGPQGYQGNQGVQGAQGSQGNQGVQGAVGAQGSQGVQGPQGTNAQNAFDRANSAFDKANTSVQLTEPNQTVTGNVTISGALTVTGNVSITGNVTQISGNTGQFFGYSGNGFNALYAGIPSGYLVEPQTVFQMSSNYDGYAGLNMQNINSGANSSADYFITSDNGSIIDGFLDLGLASSTYNYPGYSLIKPNDGYWIVAGNTTNGGGNAIISTAFSNDIILAQGGTNTNNEVARFKYNVGLGIGTPSPVNKLDVIGSIGVNTSFVLASTTFTTSTTTANQIIYSMPTATYRSAKLTVQMTSGTSYQVTELLIVHNGTTAFMTQYGDVGTTGTSLGTFDASISSGNLNLLFTPTNASTTVKLSSSLIVL